MAGLGGIPGSGKSTFAAALALVAGRIWPAGWLAVVGMDGWHYPNAVLDKKTIIDEKRSSRSAAETQGRAAVLRRFGDGGRT